MATYKSLNINLINGNAKFKSALTKVMNHSAFLKLRFKKNLRKRDIENIFTSMKVKFLQGTNVKDAISLTGPDVPDHDKNYKKLNIRNLLIPEINSPTRKVMIRSPYYLLRKHRIKIVNEEFFNATLDRILNKSYQFSDIDYDGTAFYDSVKTALIQFLTSLSINRVDGVTNKFTMVHTFCRRSKNTTSEFLDYENYIFKFLNTLGFRIHEGHYIDYSGFGSMTTILLLLETTAQIGAFMKPLPTLHYYSYTRKIALKTLVGRIKKNSIYL